MSTTEDEPHRAPSMRSDGIEALVVAAVTLSLAVAAVLVRFLTKRRSKIRMKCSDWLIIAGLLAFAATIGSYIQGIISSGGTLDLHYMNFLQVTRLYGWIYVSELLFTAATTLIKLSIISFYYDLFGTSRPFRRTLIIIAAISLVWFIVCFFVNVYQCSPTDAAWKPDLAFSGRAKCINFGKFITGYESTNMALDMSILVACIIMVTRLQLSTIKILVVSGIIALGGFVCVMCVLRIYIFTRFGFTFGLGTINLKLLLSWSNAQLAVAIICACIPSYGPLLPTQRAADRLEKWTRPRSCTANTANKWTDLHHLNIPPGGHSSYSEIEAPANAHHRNRSIVEDGIRMDRSYEVKSEKNLDYCV